MIWWFEIHGTIYSNFFKNHKEKHREKRKEKYYLAEMDLTL
jgi:hypothetical protein